MSTGPSDCPACITVQAAAAAVAPELVLVVVLDMTDDDRRPGDVAELVARGLESGRGTGYLERVIHVEDLPPGTRILSPGERNGRA